MMINRFILELEGCYFLEGMVAKSRAMLEIFHTIIMVARYPSNVLITGETGTGKDMVARAIYNLSPRQNKPFIAINCASLVEGLLESELFGHVRGAFTGALKDKPGLFEVADGGTIFLDEIGDMPLPLQAKLLRVIETGEVRRVGDTKVRKVDVRIISATNRSLKEMIKKGRFREDLYYRLNIIQIDIPPLRKRREDIPVLSSYFLGELNQKMGKDIKGLDEKVLELFKNLPWEGNARELRNVIERAYIVAKGDYITLSDIPEEYRKTTGAEEPPDISTSLEEMERNYIMEILKMTSGNCSRAARFLGISRRSLYRKLKKYGIDPSKERKQKH